jgi:tetratricopeptide (TPR) repeat protein/transcriptional regulator with XRE-family HTH domain
MRTFSELLREYIGRTGVSDAELARAVGVQRQTIFRWKEGQVGRPRSAEEVLHLAAKLRLTSAERDELLLAAGFPPVTAAVPDASAPPVTTAQPYPRSDTVDIPQAAPAPSPDIRIPGEDVAGRTEPARQRWMIWALAGVVLLLLVAAVTFVLLRQQARYPHAAADETLIVVAQFGNYTGGAQGYNVAGRLNEALVRELKAAGLKDARPAVWPTTVTDDSAAARALEQSGAALFIWGEYDSGRVVARFLPQNHLAAATRELSLTAATPADLPAVINSSLPGDIRYLALYSLAQIYLDARQPERARAALGQAGLNLPADSGTQAAHHFLWGYANQISQPPDVDAAIRGYTEALRLDNGLDAAHNNRAIAYLRRRGPGDLAAAAEDLIRFITEHGDDPAAFNNRGSAYFLLGGRDNIARALADFEKAIALAPQDPTGYYNRGLIYVRLDDEPRWRADLQRALESGHPGAHEALCWAFSLSEEPVKAVDHCHEAIKAGAGPGPWENLGVAHARCGHFAEAADALRQYRKLQPANAAGPSPKIRQIDGWVAALNAGRDPFDEATLRLLREE